MTITGEVIKQARLESGLTQAQLAKEAGVDVSQISRIEKGRIEKPAREAMMNILEHLELHPLDFYKRCRKLELEEHRNHNGDLRIGWGHCIWGAPLIVPIYESVTKADLLRGISLTSYGELDEDRRSHPYFYKSDPYGEHPKRGPSFAGCFIPEIAATSVIMESWEGTNLKTFTADDVAEMYRLGNVDGIVVPNVMADEYSKNYSDLLRCATIMFTGEACTFLVLWKDDRYTASELHTRTSSEPHEALKNYLKDRTKRNVPILFARGTIAEKQLHAHMHDLIDAVRHHNPDAAVRPREVDLGNWNQGPQSFKRLIEAEFEREGIACFLGWEPHISWAIQEIKGSFVNRFDHTPAQSIPESDKPDVHFYDVELRELLAHLDPSYKSKLHHPIRFDLLVRESAIRGETAEFGKRLEDLERFTTTLSNAAFRIGQTTSSYGRMVQYIAGYLDLPPDRCLNALNKLDFDVWYHPDWYDFVKRNLTVA